MVLIVEYPMKLMLGSFRAGGALGVRRLQIPSVFDPAPLLYPPTVPIMVAFSTGSPVAVLLNIILGFSSLPAQLIPIPAFQDGLNHLHYALVLVVVDAVMADSVHVPGASVAISNFGRVGFFSTSNSSDTIDGFSRPCPTRNITATRFRT